MAGSAKDGTNLVKKMYQTKRRIRQLTGILGNKKNSQWQRDMKESQISEMKIELRQKQKELKETYKSLHIIRKQKILLEKLKKEETPEDDR